MRPVEGAEEKSRAQRNPGAPIKTCGESRTLVVAGPRSPVDRGIVRPPPRPINHRRVVVRHVNDLGIRLLDNDGLPLRLHAHDVVGPEVPRCLRLLPQVLDRVHHLLLLGKKCVAQPLHPVQLLVHHGEHMRKRDQRLDAGIPVVPLDRLHRLVAGEIGIGPGPARGLNGFDRIGRCHQNLRQQRIRIKRDRCQHLIELLLREHGLAGQGLIRRPQLGGLRESNGHTKQQRECVRRQNHDACFHESLLVWRMSCIPRGSTPNRLPGHCARPPYPSRPADPALRRIRFMASLLQRIAALCALAYRGRARRVWSQFGHCMNPLTAARPAKLQPAVRRDSS